MPDIKWIKITTEMFDDEKIRIIEAMPEADTLIVLWIRLICMAGKINAGGHIFIAPELPYKEEELAAVFNRPLNTVRLALATFRRLKMIEVSEDGTLFLPAFGKHQNIEGMERVRQLDAARQRKRRETLRLKEGSNVMSRDSHAIDSDVDSDVDSEYKKNNDIWNNVLLKIKNSVNKQNYKTYSGKMVYVSQNDTEFIVAVPNEQIAQYLESNQRGLIEKYVTEESGSVMELKIVLMEREND